MYYQQALKRRNYPRGVRRNRSFDKHAASKTLGPVTSALFLVIIVGVLSLLYLTQITKTSVYGYEINELNREQEVLLEKQQELKVEAARLQSVARIEDSGVASELEPESNVSYDRE